MINNIARIITMQKVKIVYWQDGDFWIGYLQDYPDYMTQGETFEELEENLKDIYDDIVGDKIPS
jgi:predicted RNase H-like HicB family nuclease